MNKVLKDIMKEYIKNYNKENNTKCKTVLDLIADKDRREKGGAVA